MKIHTLLANRSASKALYGTIFQVKEILLGSIHQKSISPCAHNSWFRSVSIASDKQLQSSQNQYRLTTVVSGFPKTQTSSKFNRSLNGQIGEDAYFIARNINIPNSESGFDSKKHTNAKSMSDSSTGPDEKYETSLDNHADVIGVADGVGGWKLYGVDPSKFSRQLMQNCERLVKSGQFNCKQPAGLLANAYNEMKNSNEKAFGSSTACVAMVGHNSGTMYTANMGDSGLLVVRDGIFVHGTDEQTHCFNTPFQLSLPPPEHMEQGTLIDSPNDADLYKFKVQYGDIILLGTDGVFDNVDINLLLKLINSLNKNNNDVNALQRCCDSIVLKAQELSRNQTFLSPFAKNAMYHGYRDMFGGKEDDITVVLATVNEANMINSNEE